MRTLRRYLWREIAGATLFVLFALLALFAFFDLVSQLDDVGNAGYQLQQAFVYVGLSLPSRTYELMPIAALIGTIYALSKLASNSEFTIMRVSGMSTRRLAYVVLRVGLVFVVLTYAFGELVAPPAEQLAQRVKLQATGAPLAQQFRSGVWVRDLVKDGQGSVERLRYVNVKQVRPDVTAYSNSIASFGCGRSAPRRPASTSATGRCTDGGWPTSWRRAFRWWRPKTQARPPAGPKSCGSRSGCGLPI
jgi:lipopolysaccharide export system permease protein